MIYLKYIFLAVLGMSAGTVVSGGVFTSLIAIGLVPRFAGKTHTGGKVFLYEEMIVFGTIVGTMLSIFRKYINLRELFTINKKMICSERIFHYTGNFILIIYGVFAGIFVGCLALAIAEMLDTIPIFSRRIGFRHGLGLAILSVALGKAIGSIIYFVKDIYLYGGF